MGSPIWVDEKIYAATTEGEVVVINTGKTFELVAVNPLPEETQGTPIVGNGKLIIQTLSKLICIGK